MKILLAYDGSQCSDAAIDDLAPAGLPNDTECLALSVAEVWLPPMESEPEAPEPLHEKLVRRQREAGEAALREAEQLALKAAARLKDMFPDWGVRGEGTYGSPAWEVLRKSDEIQPDLIVVGSHGYSAINRLLLGSISQKVLTESRASVRIARGRIEVDPSPARLIVGFDGSPGSAAAVECVAARQWPEGSTVTLVAAVEPVSPSVFGRFVPTVNDAVSEINETEHEWLAESATPAIESLKRSGLSAELKILPGHAKRVLPDAAENLAADCIFVGANSFGSRLERFLIGSTSAAVAARARCSVEVVRRAV